MNLSQALEIAERTKSQLAPFCERIEIAGSIRRRREFVGDIEIVAIPLPYNVGLFESGIATIVNRWQKVKGELPCKYTQRILPEGIKLDLFFAEPGNWGNIFAMRTGSAEYSHNVLAVGWVKCGYKSIDGYLWKDDRRYDCREEIDLFKRINVDFVEPQFREFPLYAPAPKVHHAAHRHHYRTTPKYRK